MNKLFIPRKSLQQACLLACMPLFYVPNSLATSVNLVVNGDFEADRTSSWAQANNITGWTGIKDKVEYGTQETYDVRGGKAGNLVAELDANIAGNDTGFFQLIPTQNKMYTLSVDIAGRSGINPQNNGLEVWWRGAKIATVRPASIQLSTYSFDVQGSGGNDKLTFYEENGHDDSYGGIVDNVKLLDQVSYNCQEQTSQLVVNGSFEQDVTSSWMSTPSIKGWSMVGDTIETGRAGIYGVTGATGAQVAEIDANIKSGVTGFYQNITTQNKVYTVSVDMAARVGTPTETNGVEIWWRGSLIATVVPSITKFTTYKFNVPGSGGSDRLEFRERTGKDASGNSYDESFGGLIDNVSIMDTTLSGSCPVVTPTSGSGGGSGGGTAALGESGQISWREVTAPVVVQDAKKAAKAAAKAASSAP